MNFTYIIIEDNPGAIENLRIELKKYSYLTELGFATNTNDGIALALKKGPHIIFLDVELGKGNGFDVLEEIKSQSARPPCFIITTDYLKYGKDAVNLGALYFLDKPVDPDELNAAMRKVESHFKKQDDCLRVKNSEGHFFIDLTDIRYIESKNNCCTIYRDNFPPVTVSRTLKDIEAVLPDKFLRIHNSYIVNRSLVHKMNTSKKTIEIRIMENGTHNTLSIPIGALFLTRVKLKLLGG